MNHWIAFIINSYSLYKCYIIAILESLFIQALINFQFKENVTCITLFRGVGWDSVRVVQENVSCDQFAQGEQSILGVW
jgi:hypothetical protein